MGKCIDCGKKLSLKKYIRCNPCRGKFSPKVIKNIASKKFGKLTVIKQVGFNKWRNALWLVKHSCGHESIKSQGKIVKGKNIISCPVCNQHRLGHTRFYDIWGKMLKRCNKENCATYKYYGGRGIKVLWKSFIEFKNDMYKSYLEHSENFGEKQTTIDRIDVNGNYELSNCHWATQKEQARNMRSNKIIEFNGLKLCLSEWTERLKFKTGVIQSRLKHNWPIERALTELPYCGKNQFSKRT